jgi:hypothetical protein
VKSRGNRSQHPPKREVWGSGLLPKALRYATKAIVQSMNVEPTAASSKLQPISRYAGRISEPFRAKIEILSSEFSPPCVILARRALNLRVHSDRIALGLLPSRYFIQGAAMAANSPPSTHSLGIPGFHFATCISEIWEIAAESRMFTFILAAWRSNTAFIKFREGTGGSLVGVSRRRAN